MNLLQEINQRFDDWYKNTESQFNERKARVQKLVPTIQKKFESWAQKNQQKFDDERSDNEFLSLRRQNNLKFQTPDAKPVPTPTLDAIRQRAQRYESGDKQWWKDTSKILNTIRTRFDDYMKKSADQFVTESNAARKSGVWQTPFVPLAQGFKKDIEKIPVVGGALSAFTTMDDATMASIEKLRRGETISKEEAERLNQENLNLMMGMTGGVSKVGKLSPLRNAAKGSATNVRVMDNPLLLGKDWQKKVSQAARETLDDITKAARAAKDPIGTTEPFDQMVRQAGQDVRHKVGLLDYIRTPDRILQKIGLGNEAKQLRVQYDKYLDELPKEINKIKGWMERVPKESNERIFQWLDGKKIQLVGEEQKVALEIKDYLVQWADKLGLPQDKRITSYITHLFPKEAGMEFDPEIAHLIRGKVAGSVYNPFLKKRIGAPGYLEDTWQALQAYTKRAVRKVNMDPTLAKLKEVSETLETSQYNYVRELVDRVNLRPTDIDTLIDNTIKQSLIGYKFGSRPVANLTPKMRRMVYRGTLGLNISSAIKNLAQGANTYAELGEKYTAIGYYKVAKNLPKLLSNADTELNKVGVLADDLLMDARQVTVWKSLTQKMDDGLFYLFNLAEKINRGAAYWGAKAKAHQLGMADDAAIKYAKDVVGKTQFRFGSIDTPVALQSDLMKTFFQLQTYGVKQFEFLGEKVAAKDIAGLVRWTGSTLLLTAAFKKAFGWGWDTLLPQARLGVPPTLQAPYGAFQAATQSTDKYGNPLTVGQRLTNNNLTSGLINYVPAGAQLKKTYQGAKAIGEGGSYTQSGRLRYPVEAGLQPLLFGPTRTEAGQEYYGSGGSPLGEKQTQQYQALIDSGVDPDRAYAMMTSKRDSDNKFESIVNKASGKESFGDKVQSFISGLFGGSKEEESTLSDDPLIAAYQQEIEGDAKASRIKEIFGLGLSKSETERALQEAGLGSYEEASITVMKSLGVENGNRGRMIQALVKDLKGDEKKAQLLELADQGVLTTGVISQWLDSGIINQQQAQNLKDLVSMAKGTYSPKKPKIIPLKKFNIPEVKPYTITSPGLPASLKRGIQTPRTKLPQLPRARIQAPSLESQYSGKIPFRQMPRSIYSLGGLQ